MPYMIQTSKDIKSQFLLPNGNSITWNCTMNKKYGKKPQYCVGF